MLVDGSGRRIMAGAHPLADLAPRDVVSATIAAHLRRTGDQHVWLDATGLGADFVARRFPGILRACRAAGYDLATEPVPVAPAAHYTCGGVLADLDGRTSVEGLFAVGEVACTGVHGANRLASNSITEGLVAARRCADLLTLDLPDGGEPVEPAPAVLGAIDPAARPSITAATTRDAGVVRDADGLAPARRRARRRPPAARRPAAGPRRPRGHRAAHRGEPAVRRGARADREPRRPPPLRRAADTDPEWEVRLVHRLDDAGHVHTRTQPVRSLVVAA